MIIIIIKNTDYYNNNNNNNNNNSKINYSKRDGLGSSFGNTLDFGVVIGGSYVIRNYFFAKVRPLFLFVVHTFT